MLAEDKQVKIKVEDNLKIKEATAKLNTSIKQAIKDVVRDIANTAIKEHPYRDITGTNTRSIMYEVGPGGAVAKGELEGAVYSTSGYGGYLETGTVHMPAFPYLKPALDKNIHKLPAGIKANLGRY